mgnify:CR=1 FL=1
MKKKYILRVKYLVFYVVVFLPMISYGAAANAADNAPAASTGVTRISPPLGSSITLKTLIDKLLNIVVAFGGPIIILAIIYSGFLFVKAQGNKDDLVVAKNAILWTIIGAAVILGAKVLETIIVGTVSQLK